MCVPDVGVCVVLISVCTGVSEKGVGVKQYACVCLYIGCVSNSGVVKYIVSKFNIIVVFAMVAPATEISRCMRFGFRMECVN